MRDRPEPSLDAIEQLASELQIVLPPALPGADRWPDRLRLLASWAVKPGSYNAAFLRFQDRELRGPRREAFLAAREEWRSQGKDAPGKVTDLPDYNLYCYGNGRLRAASKLPSAAAALPGLAPDYRAFYPYEVELGEWNLGGHGRMIQIAPDYDPTPNEWGIRAWCLQVLEVRGWRSPLTCDVPLANPEQWRNSSGPVGNHPIADSGDAQLAFWGFDFPTKQLRPTLDVRLWDTVYYLIDTKKRIIWQRAIHPGLAYTFPSNVRKDRVHPLWQDWQQFAAATAAKTPATH